MCVFSDRLQLLLCTSQNRLVLHVLKKPRFQKQISIEYKRQISAKKWNLKKILQYSAYEGN